MEIVSIILNFLLGSGIAGMLIFHSSKRREAAAQASRAENGAREGEFGIQRENIEFLSARLSEAWGEVEKMQELLNCKRDEIVALIAQTKQLEIELICANAIRQKAEFKACHRSDCKERITTTILN